MALEKLGGRRFLLACSTALTTTGLQLLGKLDPAGSTYALVMVGVVGAYITGDVMEKKHAGQKDSP